MFKLCAVKLNVKACMELAEQETPERDPKKQKKTTAGHFRLYCFFFDGLFQRAYALAVLILTISKTFSSVVKFQALSGRALAMASSRFVAPARLQQGLMQ